MGVLHNWGFSGTGGRDIREIVEYDEEKQTARETKFEL
jgi:hypothetical protein